MATQAYRDWIARGKPYSVARPVAETVEYAERHGIAVLGVIGNDAHLQSNNPQDHTPFSNTEWPVPIQEYIVTACDLESGAWCWDFLARCRSGELTYVKYINFFNTQYSVKNGWVGTPNSDYHFHMSVRSDRLNTKAIDPWAPKAVAPQRKDDEVKLIYAPDRGWARIGTTWTDVGSQNAATVNAKVFGDSIVLTATEYDLLKSTYTTASINKTS